MKTVLSQLDRRRFIRSATGFALALPAFETFASSAKAAAPTVAKKRLACFYIPDGVPMPRKEDPAFQDWSWFPQGKGRDFKLTKCLDPLEPLRDDLTILGGLSHPAVRNVHGHSNAETVRFSSSIKFQLKVFALGLQGINSILFRLKKITYHDQSDQGSKSIILLSQISCNFLQICPIRKTKRATKCIGGEFMNHCTDELILAPF